MFSGFFQPKDIAIDLGTCNTLVYVRGQGIVLDEPSVVAIRSEGGPLGKKSLQAVGRDAKAMLGKVPGHLNAIRPMRGGVIADFALTELMLKEFIRKVRPSKGFFGSLPRMVICVPCGSTQVERRAIRESALATGAKQVFLLEEPIAAAFGAGMPVTEATGSMVVVIGGGSTEVAVISLGGMVIKSSLRVGGDKFDDAIIAHVRRHHGVLIGEHTAENIKIAVGSALPTKQVLQMEVNGRHMGLGVPRSFTINSNEVTQALTEPLGQIIEAVRNALESTPPELGADIANKGMVLAGGGALLRDLDKLLSDAIGVPVFIAPEPLTCVARGCGMTLERLDDPAKLFS
jgi:rod shape-determining protein MreB